MFSVTKTVYAYLKRNFLNDVNCVTDQYFGLQVVRLGMFEVQSHKLVHSLVKRAQELQQKLVTRMLQDHQEINKKSVGSPFSLFFSPHPRKFFFKNATQLALSYSFERKVDRDLCLKNTADICIEKFQSSDLSWPLAKCLKLNIVPVKGNIQ